MRTLKRIKAKHVTYSVSAGLLTYMLVGLAWAVGVAVVYTLR